MAILINQYKAICILNECDELCHIGKVGLLLIYVSVNKCPGMPFIIFHSKNLTLHTSPGEMGVDVENMTISLQTKYNFYKFKVSNQIILYEDTNKYLS